VSWKGTLAALIAAVLAAAPVRAWSPQEEPVTLWVLPLDNPGADPTLDDLARAVSDLLQVAFARLSACAVVDRAHLSALLSEQSLSAAELARPDSRRSIARLLGARWMCQGSLARRGARLWIAVHVIELESTRVLASQQIEADPAELAPRLSELAEGLVRAVLARPCGGEGAVDSAPAANLGFLRGLSHYYAGQYHRALAEFLRSGATPELADGSALWRANCYLALAQPEHAFLELARLRRRATHVLDPAELDERLERCRRQLTSDELRTCEWILSGG
jgi:TolB-like protein